MNPEFRRNVWLELTKERLIAIPAIVALGVAAIASMSDWSKVGWNAWYAAAGLGLIWGPRLSSASIVREISGRTWDGQRASALSGWQMAWAKLAGSTLAPWYGIALLVAAWTGAGMRGPAGSDWALLILSCILAQAVAMATALILIQDRRAPIRSGVPHFLGAATGLVALQHATLTNMLDRTIQLGWYGLRPGADAIETGSLAFLAAWSVVAVWRAMAQALQIPLRPWAWPLFLLTLCIWLAGLMPNSFGRDVSQAQFGIAFVAALSATWIAALIDPKSPVGLNRWRMALRASRPAASLMLTPAWILGLPIVIGLASAVAISFEHKAGAASIALPLILFLARDIALMHLVALTGKPGRGVSVLVYLAVLYGLVPLLLNAMGWKSLLLAFIPATFGQTTLPALLLLILQVLIAVALAWRAMRRFDQTTPASA
jgi:hypothetical protein